ncbi:MAG TPA: ABC transporter permease [Ktedonobacteraceae bacterium]|nr:ABC transporter permease [Ktedonobacteraceae bacterium]
MAETVISDAPPPETEQPAERPVGFWIQLGRLFVRQREASILIVTILLLAYFWISSSNFITGSNVRTIFEYFSETAIIAVGEVFLLICGEIDLSVGQVFALAPFVMYFANQAGVPMWLSIIIALLVSLVVGLLNGVITVWFRIPSLITTLGTLFLINGITLTISNSFPVIPPHLGQLNNIMGAAPYSEIIWAVAIALVFQIVLSFTRWGMHTFATGGNSLGASEAGVNVNRIKIGNFMLASVLGGFAGILSGFRIDSIDPLAGGTTIMFNAVAGAVIGGTALIGGIGTVVGAFLGVLALSILQDGFTLLGVNATTYDIVLGAAILVAMIVNQGLRAVREARR